MNAELIARVRKAHVNRFGERAAAVSFAPGRVEVLGNHTDYNEGFVLSGAIDLGIAAAIGARPERKCTLRALDLDEEIEVDLPATGPLDEPVWANYVLGVLDGLSRHGFGDLPHGFRATFAGDIPMAAGLSSSAALETAAAIGFCAVAGVEMEPLETARLCQAAEHRFVGTQCGLLDQISSLFGEADSLVFTDFRSLRVETDVVGPGLCFLMADTRVKHNLVESEYNERRARCEEAASFFAAKLEHPVKSLRDVSRDEWNRLAPEMDPVTARRAAHVIGENLRVLEGRKRLARGDTDGFGRLMFESHESSRANFGNSCPELDMIVSEARNIESVKGARLSGGGFGGSAVLLVRPGAAKATARMIEDRYGSAFGQPCEVRKIKPSGGATVLR